MCRCAADRDKLEQVLRNLLDNALKFTSQGHIVVQAEITEAERITITVVDTGCGIPPDHQQKILTSSTGRRPAYPRVPVSAWPLPKVSWNSRAARFGSKASRDAAADFPLHCPSRENLGVRPSSRMSSGTFVLSPWTVN